MPDDTLRIGDRERDRAAELLADHYAAGRLAPDEFDERSSAALRALTAHDLEALFADLPPSGPAHAVATTTERPHAQPDPTAQQARHTWRTASLFPWAAFAVLFIVIWLATGAGYLWPVWPILGWGISVAIDGVAARTDPSAYLARQRERGGCGRVLTRP